MNTFGNFKKILSSCINQNSSQNSTQKINIQKSDKITTKTWISWKINFQRPRKEVKFHFQTHTVEHLWRAHTLCFYL